MSNSIVKTFHDNAGDYEQELFAPESPKRVIVCSHGNGVRRWDGQRFFYAVAEHYSDVAVYTVDQNQAVDDGVALNSIHIMAVRIQKTIERAHIDYPDLEIVLIGHSMGCSVITYLDLKDVSKVVFISAAAGDPFAGIAERYGAGVKNGTDVKTSDGRPKIITKEYIDSIQNVNREDQYREMLQRFEEVYAFESGDEEIVGVDRFKHREMPFKSYKIIPKALHNFVGPPLIDLLSKIDKII